MSREIKFRYICKDASGKFFTFFITLEELEQGKLNINTYSRIQEIISRDQYIERKDKKDKEIYEKDLLSGNIHGQSGRIEPLEVEIPNVYWLEEGGMFEPSKTKIIGNISENPKLLKDK